MHTDVSFYKNRVLISKKRRLGGVKGVADTLVKLDRGYRTNFRSFWKQKIYRRRHELQAKNTWASYCQSKVTRSKKYYHIVANSSK